MTINNDAKLEYLWKHSQGASSTSPDKEPHNEAIGTYAPVFQNHIWSNSGELPTPAPLVEPTALDAWNGLLFIHQGTRAVQLKMDPSTVNGTAWIAVVDPALPATISNRLIDWVPPRYHGSYRAKLWSGDPTVPNASLKRLSAQDSGFEWDFDYTAGVLYFHNEVPAVVLQNGIWLEGWRYTGLKGGGAGGAGGSNKLVRQFEIETPLLQAGDFYDFDLPTGASCTLLHSAISAPGRLESHAYSDRLDTNPYRFVGVASQLVDDGSYVVAGQRYYGSRFVNLQNLQDNSSRNTYWRVYNTTSEPSIITVNIKTVG